MCYCCFGSSGHCQVVGNICCYFSYFISYRTTTFGHTSVTAAVTPSVLRILNNILLDKLVSQDDKLYTLILSGTTIELENTTAMVVSLTLVIVEPVGAFQTYPVALATALILKVSATPVIANELCVNKQVSTFKS